jgi:hypothetical protein
MMKISKLNNFIILTLTFPKLTIFFKHVPIQANLLSGKIVFSLKSFLYSECKKIKGNFISFRNMLLKNK